MLMEMFMMATGKMTRHTALEFIVILTELVIRDTGRRISSTDRALKPGQMVQATRETTSKGARMEKAASHGQTRALTQGTLLRIISKAKVRRGQKSSRERLNRLNRHI